MASGRMCQLAQPSGESPWASFASSFAPACDALGGAECGVERRLASLGIGAGGVGTLLQQELCQPPVAVKQAPLRPRSSPSTPRDAPLASRWRMALTSP